MDKTNIWTILANTGELLVVVGVALWIANADIMKYVFASGATLMAVGRFVAHGASDGASITLRRLYVQRNIGVVMLLVAALLMFVWQTIDGTEIGQYSLKATKAAWFLPFLIFVVIELYTAFRIPAQTKKEEQ